MVNKLVIMRKIFLSIVGSLSCVAGFAQLSIQDTTGKTLKNGDTVKVSGISRYQISDNFIINNSGGSIKVSMHSLPTSQFTHQSTYSICVGTNCYMGVGDSDSFQVPTSFTVPTGQYSKRLFTDYNPDSVYPGITTILFVAYDVNTTSDSAWIYVQFNALPTGIQGIIANTIHMSSLYPNPANSVVNFTYHTNYDAQLSVYNSIGQLINTVSLSSSKESARINTAGMPSGIYICKVQAEGAEPAYRKLVVSH